MFWGGYIAKPVFWGPLLFRHIATVRGTIGVSSGKCIIWVLRGRFLIGLQRY